MESLEHFILIEDVIAHIRTKLPDPSNAERWKHVCTDVLHCQLPVVEPVLLKELAAVRGQNDKEQEIRALLRAVSWYQHPAKSREELLTALVAWREAPFAVAHQTELAKIQVALQTEQQGTDVLPAAQAVEMLFVQVNTVAERETLREVRDQLYYQLLYPHWFEIVKEWHAKHST